jgi:prevent-host-death family protein
MVHVYNAEARRIMSKYDIVQAKAHLSAIVNEALEGREVILTKRGKPVVKVVRLAPPATEPRKLGLHPGTFIIKPGFDDPLTEFEEYA